MLKSLDGEIKNIKFTWNKTNVGSERYYKNFKTKDIDESKFMFLDEKGHSNEMDLISLEEI